MNREKKRRETVNRVCNLVIAFILAIGLIACGQESEQTSEAAAASTWQEQYDLGVRYLSEGNYEEAIIAFTAAIEIDPNRAETYVGRGDAYIGSGEEEDNLSAAQSDYETAIELDAANVQAYLGLADVYTLRGEYEKALEVLEQGRQRASEGDTSIFTDRISAASIKIQAEEQAYIFTEHMLSCRDLCIGEIPFWEISITDAANYYYNELPDVDSNISEFEDVLQFNAFSARSGGNGGWGYIMLQQSIGNEGVEYVQYSLTDTEWHNGTAEWCDTPIYIADLSGGMSRLDFLQKIGLSDEGVEFFIEDDDYIILECYSGNTWIGRGEAHSPEDAFYWDSFGYDSLDISRIEMRWDNVDGYDINAEFSFTFDQLNSIHLSRTKR